MAKNIDFIRGSAHPEAHGYIVDVYLRNGEFEAGEYVPVNIGEMPETLKYADPCFVGHVRNSVRDALIEAAVSAGLSTDDVDAKVTAYFDVHFPTESLRGESMP